MRPDLLNDVLKRIKLDYNLVEKGEWLQLGKCPACGKKELYTNATNPWVLRCGRSDRCGQDFMVKALYPDIFDEWSTRHPATPENPDAAADAFLLHARGLDLGNLRGHYSQESYFDKNLNLGSATVRFPLPGGGWWERLIDQPGRFGKMKARFAFGKSYAGEWWQPPTLTTADIIAAPELWIAEGIFDAESLHERGIAAVSGMSCNNYPALALKALEAAIAAGPTPMHRPKLIWAYDANNAGRRFTKKHVKEARAAGWECGAALTEEALSAKPRDWNDLHLLDSADKPIFDAEHLDEYRWNGDLLIAASADEAAKLISLRKGLSGFALDFAQRTYWTTVNEARVAEIIAEMGGDPDLKALPAVEKRAIALDSALNVSEIANCTFAPLYFEMDPVTNEGSYYFQIDFPVERPVVKNRVSAAQIVAAPDFAKRLASLSSHAVFTGSTYHLQHMRRRWADIREVNGVNVTGYVKEHGTWVFPDHAVKGGKVYLLNKEDYFEIGKLAIKPTSAERVLEIEWDGGEYNAPWVGPFYATFGTRGMVALTYWFGTLFAEQIRAKLQSWPFLEIVGEAGTGKSTLLEFLWWLVGRPDYEGFDPAKGSAAFRRRSMAKVGNLPVVLIESDRSNDDRLHSKQFDWDELKTAFNGRSPGGRAVANGGMETIEPPFRAAIVIAQNEAVNASTPIMERIVHIEDFTKSMQTPASHRAIKTLLGYDKSKLSAFCIEVVRREAELLPYLFERFAHHEKMLLTGTVNIRLAKNHAQLLACLDALAKVVSIPVDVMDRTADAVRAMCIERHKQIAGDHEMVVDFWRRIEHIETGGGREGGTITTLNHSIDPELIAISLIEFEQFTAARKLQLPIMADLKRHLKTSKSPKFVEQKPVRSAIVHGTKHCWVFRKTPASKPEKD